MNCPAEYWIWLQRTLGVGKDVGELLAYFGDPQKIYEAGRNNLLLSGIINRKTADSLSRFSPSQSYDVMQQCKNNGWKIISYDDENYPCELKKLTDAPLVLYVCGDETVLKSSFCLGMVGTRNASEYGIRTASDIAYSMAKCGAVIVSGGALGIDSASHTGAMDAGGKTVAFLGSGLGSKYLAENEPLRKRISENGALVSEFLPYTEPTRFSFPIRNRLISGMSKGTVVVEAGEKSGSIITARTAVKQGRDLFAVPGEIYNSKHIGTNMLINNGAVAVFDVADIADFYGELIEEINGGVMPDIKLELAKKHSVAQPVQVTWQTAKTEKIKKKSETAENRAVSDSVANITVGNEKKEIGQKMQLPEYATENASKLYAVMTSEPKTADELVFLSGMSVQDVLSAVTELEIYSAVMIHSGKRYGLKII